MKLEHQTIGPEVGFCQYRGCIQPASIETLDGQKMCPECLELTALTWMFVKWPRKESDEYNYVSASHFAICKFVRLGQVGGMMVKDFNLMWSRIIDRCRYLQSLYGNCEQVIHDFSTGYPHPLIEPSGP